MKVPTIKAARVVFNFLLVASFAMVSQNLSASDFYLRLGVGMDQESNAIFSDRNCLNLYPIALYGCGRGTGRISVPIRRRIRIVQES